MESQQQVIECETGRAIRGAPQSAPSTVGKYPVVSRPLVGILWHEGRFKAVGRGQHRFRKPGVAGSSPAGRVGESAFLVLRRPICFSPQSHALNCTAKRAKTAPQSRPRIGGESSFREGSRQSWSLRRAGTPSMLPVASSGLSRKALPMPTKKNAHHRGKATAQRLHMRASFLFAYTSRPRYCAVRASAPI